MSAEESGGAYPQEEAVERGIAEGSPRPAAPGTAAPVPSVEVRREVVDRLPVTQLSPVQIGQQFDRMRAELEANPRLVDDVSFMRTYGALAAQERGANLQPVLEQDLTQLDPYGRLPVPDAPLGAPPELSPEAQRVTGGWDPTAREALHDIAKDSRWPPHVVDDGYQLLARVAGQGVPSVNDAYTALEARWGERVDEQVAAAQEVIDLLAHDDEPRVRKVHEWLVGLSNHPDVTVYLAEVISPLLRTRPMGPLLLGMRGRWAEAQNAPRARQRAEQAAQAVKVAQEREAAVREGRRLAGQGRTADAQWGA